MKKELSLIGIALSILLLVVTTSSVTAQNATTNATMSEAGKNVTNAAGNAVKSANQTVGEMGKNMSPLSVMLDKPNQTMSELRANASNAMNNTGEAVNATANELGKNASDIGLTILNKTNEVGKKNRVEADT
jgi:hypothetical protein